MTGGPPPTDARRAVSLAASLTEAVAGTVRLVGATAFRTLVQAPTLLAAHLR